MHDAHEAGYHADPYTKHELDFEITNTEARPPVANVVGRPDEGVDHVHQISEEDVEDQSERSKIAVADVPDERRKVDDDCDEREGRECNGGGAEGKFGRCWVVHGGVCR